MGTSLAMISEPREALAVGLAANEVIVLSLPALDHLAELHLDAPVRSVCFSPEGTFLTAVGGMDSMNGLFTKSAPNSFKTSVWTVDSFKVVADIEFDGVLNAA